MAQCSVPGCKAAATLQWLRVATPAEADAHLGFLAAGQQAISASRRGSLELQIADLQSMRARLAAEGRLTPGASKALDDTVAVKQAALDRDDVPAAVFTGGVTVAVFGCDAHRIDLDAATQTHGASCSTAGPCGCDLPAPVDSDDEEPGGPVGS
jgi:hypothetical protein